MTLLHELQSLLLGDSRRPRSSLYDQNLRSGLYLEDLVQLSRSPFLSVPLLSGYIRPWRLTQPEESGTSNLNYNKEEFKVRLDVQQFKPEEIKVKVADRFVLIEGKHEERKDEYGLVSRRFTRRYKLPDNIDDKTLKSSISSDGILMLEAHGKEVLSACFYKNIPIVETGKPASAVPSKAIVKKEEMAIIPADYYQKVPIILTSEPAKNNTEGGQGDAAAAAQKMASK